MGSTYAAILPPYWLVYDLPSSMAYGPLKNTCDLDRPRWGHAMRLSHEDDRAMTTGNPPSTMEHRA